MKILMKERPSINKNHKITFPKVTLCLNSMHSKRALEEYPSEMEEYYNLSTEMLLEYYYIGGETINRSYPIFDGLDKYNMSEFHAEPLQNSVSMTANIIA